LRRLSQERRISRRGRKKHATGPILLEQERRANFKRVPGREKGRAGSAGAESAAFLEENGGHLSPPGSNRGSTSERRGVHHYRVGLKKSTSHGGAGSFPGEAVGVETSKSAT